MRDWLSAFLPASFRGVSFKVDIEGTSGGRRLSISPIAYADSHVIEDMGGALGTFDVTAYVAGDVADHEARALIAALGVKGPSIAVLPMLGPKMLRVEHWSINRYKYRAGFVAIDIAFVEEGIGAVPFLAGAAAGRIANSISAGITVLSAALSTALEPIAPSRRAADALAATSGLVDVVTVSALSVTGGETPSAMSDAVADLADITPDAMSDVEGYASTTMMAWRSIGLHSDADTAFDLIRDKTVVPANVTPIVALNLVASASAMTLAAARRDYPARRDARDARQQMAETIDPVLTAVASVLGGDSFAYISQLAGDAAIDLSRLAADRAPMVRVETGLSMPSTALSYAIYGDANRAVELVNRNSVSTSCLMPVAIEALAP